MLPISVLERTATSILYELPPGKPNPQVQCTIEGEARERVVQSADKGDACWYYTLNFIRRRIGKNPCEELRAARLVEEACSSHRKARTACMKALPFIANGLHLEAGVRMLRDIDVKRATYYLAHREIGRSIYERPGDISVFPFFEKFVKEGSCKNMEEFFVQKKYGSRISANIELLRKIGIAEQQPDERIDSDVFSRASSLDAKVRNASAKAYGLKVSSWAPVQGVDALISELKKNGPLAVCGALGVPFDREESFKLDEKIGSRDIYAWRSETKKGPPLYSNHAVLLVGAKKVENMAQDVFFIDSADPSDPKDPSTQKIYRISFANLWEHICDLDGYNNTKNADCGYGYYGSFAIFDSEAFS